MKGNQWFIGPAISGGVSRGRGRLTGHNQKSKPWAWGGWDFRNLKNRRLLVVRRQKPCGWSQVIDGRRARWKEDLHATVDGSWSKITQICAITTSKKKWMEPRKYLGINYIIEKGDESLGLSISPPPHRPTNLSEIPNSHDEVPTSTGDLTGLHGPINSMSLNFPDLWGVPNSSSSRRVGPPTPLQRFGRVSWTSPRLVSVTSASNDLYFSKVKFGSEIPRKTRGPRAGF